MEIIETKAFARAGLLGNPSDGFNGKTISFSVQDFRAKVILYEWERIEFQLSQEDLSHFDTLEELAKDVELHGYYGGIRLVKATVKKFYEFCRTRVGEGDESFELSDTKKFAIRYETNIPRQVGLAGSSAIIVATLRALMRFYDVDIPLHVQPSLVLSVETDELGIKGGLQDRVIQVYGGLVYMDFSEASTTTEFGFACGRYEPLDAQLLRNVYIAYSTDVGSPTEQLHNPLRALYESGDTQVVGAMQTFADCAEAGCQALLDGDQEQLAEVIDRNFDTRKAICQLPREHIEMVEAARSVGATAKFAGSGGAIVGTYANEAMFSELRRALPDCRVFRPVISDS